VLIVHEAVWHQWCWNALHAGCSQAARRLSLGQRQVVQERIIEAGYKGIRGRQTPSSLSLDQTPTMLLSTRLGWPGAISVLFVALAVQVSSAPMYSQVAQEVVKPESTPSTTRPPGVAHKGEASALPSQA
jgi:hypothetical protein